ncbi:hypothetical protein ElyMa_003636000 [Elysia marginata]|uniref:Uncharacterized protein n=1 Tax=Elysia marginata TaxID=1093978 RepID=A0AAV4EW98_9GAST|nr:hypothetical protein ElyMa_003636000 [Elysia marginata]
MLEAPFSHLFRVGRASFWGVPVLSHRKYTANERVEALTSHNTFLASVTNWPQKVVVVKAVVVRIVVIVVVVVIVEVVIAAILVVVVVKVVVIVVVVVEAVM